MTNTDILRWIKTNFGPIISQAIAAAKGKNPHVPYTEDWLAGIQCRESGGIIAKHLPAMLNLPSGRQLASLMPLMKGDWNQREHDAEPMYHGYGPYQADIASFPAWIKSGAWQDPAKAASMAIEILEGKRLFLQPHFPDLAGDLLERAITAAYNCGEGNVRDVLNEGHDIDIRTTDKNYSAQIWEFRKVYQTL